MQITDASLQAIFQNFDLRFQQAYTDQAPILGSLYTEVPSTTRENTYAWLAKIPRLREWLGERVVQNAAAHGFSVTNKPFELTLELDRDDIEDDQIGVFNPAVTMMGQQTKLWPDDLVREILEDGESALCFDGQNFYDTDHPANQDDSGSATQQNYWSSGKALTAENYQAVRAAMMQFKGADKRPLGVKPNLLQVPPALEKTALEILNADIIVGKQPGGSNTGSQSNVLRGTAELLVDPYLSSDTAWYLHDTSKAIKPFVFQNRRAPEFAYLRSPTDEPVFWRKKFVFGVNTRGNAGYALWFLSAKASA